MPFEGRYVNWAREGECVFVTSNVLGKTPAFRRKGLASLMVGSLLSDHRFYEALFFGFVVMPDHIHFLSGVPAGRDASWLVGRIKANSAKRLLRQMNAPQRAALSDAAGASNRSFWMEGFRSFPVMGERSFLQKLRYIHRNPVAAKLCTLDTDYGFSSAQLWHDGVDIETGIAIDDDLIERFCSKKELQLYNNDPSGGSFPDSGAPSPYS